MTKAWMITATALAAALAAAGCGPKPKGGSEGNRPPHITEAAIQPEQPSVDSQISLKLTCSDPDGDQVSYRVEWLVNGRAQTSGPELSLSTRGLAQGDRISARILPSDGRADGEWFETGAVELWPKVAGIDSLGFEPSPLTAGLERVSAIPHLAGPEPPEQLRLVYQWTVDGRSLPDSGGSISTQPLRVGQRVVVEAVPVLGTERGKPYRAMATVVGAPPVIKSVDFASRDSAHYTYHVDAEDPASEPLTYSLAAAPAGVAIDPKTGDVRIPVKAMGETIRIRVANKSGSWVERRLETSQ